MLNKDFFIELLRKAIGGYTPGLIKMERETVCRFPKNRNISFLQQTPKLSAIYFMPIAYRHNQETTAQDYISEQVKSEKFH